MFRMNLHCPRIIIIQIPNFVRHKYETITVSSDPTSRRRTFPRGTLTANGQPDVSARSFTGSRSNHTGIRSGVVRVHVGYGEMALVVNAVSYVERQRNSATRPLHRRDGVSRIRTSYRGIDTCYCSYRPYRPDIRRT